MSAATDRTPPFPVEEGHTVRFPRKRGGMDAGYFQRWKRGLPLTAYVLTTGGRTIKVPALSLRPVNDTRMVSLRGVVEVETTNPTRKVVRR
jgi:hypothetical protein